MTLVICKCSQAEEISNASRLYAGQPLAMKTQVPTGCLDTLALLRYIPYWGAVATVFDTVS